MKIFVSLLACFASLAAGQRIKDSIYTELEGIRPCFRRLNGTQEIGCTSAIGGNVGVIQYLENSADLDGLLQEQFGPYVILLDPAILSGELLHRMRDSGQVVGVILPSVTDGNWAGHYPKFGNGEGYSDDSSCPNPGSGESGCNKDNVWNPSASGTMWEEWGFPIFLIQDANSTASLHQCWSEHNVPLSWPLCSVELKGNMYAAKDSQTCIRRSNLFNITPLTVCDPLSDSNTVYWARCRNATSPSTESDKCQREEKDKSVMVVAARMDALALFDQVEVGFDSPSTGIVTLLATAKLVAKALSESSFKFKAGVENILFVLLQGESFDNIGSSRLVYDMQHDAFPFDLAKAKKEGRLLDNGTQPLLNMSKVKFWIELGQLAPAGAGSDLYIHSKGQQSTVDEVKSRLRANSQGLNVRDTTRASMPPCSAQSILKEDPSMPSLLLTNYDKEFENKMFHSIYDSAAFHEYNNTLGSSQPVVSRLASVAEMVADAVISLASEVVPSPGERQQLPNLVNEMLHCYTISANCTMFHEASEPGNFPWRGGPPTVAPFPQYVGVRGSAHTLMTRMLLQYLTGEKVEGDQVQGIEEVTEGKPDLAKDRADCLAKNTQQNVFRYIYLVGKDCYNKTEEVVECGSCYRTTVDSTPASSPAFLEGVTEDYDWASGVYPTWTESIWKVINARVFLQGDPSHDHGVFSLGVIILVLSLASVWWLQKNAPIIFGESAACQENPPVNM